jgi:ABC-type branched-subunit amino acid transport system ATPase component
VDRVSNRFKLVEQKVHELVKIAHRIYALRMGEIVFSGTTSELQTGDVMKSIFLV